MSTREKGEDEDRPGDRGRCKSVWRVKGMTINEWGLRKESRSIEGKRPEMKRKGMKIYLF
jgi:hypothetical protein